jgi:hypothetical protein
MSRKFLVAFLVLASSALAQNPIGPVTGGIPASVTAALGNKVDKKTVAQLGQVYEVYLSNREIANSGDGVDGIGTKNDPRSAGTSAKLEAVLASIPPYSTINLIQGPFLIKRHDLVTTNLKSGWTIKGNSMYETTVRLDPTEVIPVYGGALFTSQYNLETDNVTIRDLTVDSNWPAVAASATVGAGSNTFTASITSGSPVLVGGTDSVGNLANSGGGFTAVDLTRALTGTGIPGGTTVLRNSATTVGTSSDAVTLPQSTINVVSTTDFASAGTFFIVTSGGALQYITYTGKTSTTFTGCTGGTLTINASNPISTLSQLVMSANATATNASASITIGGEREGALGAIGISGSNNLVQNVRSINTYGSNANGQELFAIGLGVPSGTDGQTSNGGTNNWILDCRVEKPSGNYGAPFALSGAGDSRPITQSGVMRSIVMGVNNGLNPGFTTGGVNLAYIKGITIADNTFTDCSALSYQDTGSSDGLFIYGNKLIRGSLGVGSAQSSATLKQNIFVTNNRMVIQNRGNGGGSYAIGNFGSTATTNFNIHGNSVGFDGGGLGLNSQTRFIYSTVGLINSDISYNTLDTDGNGTYIAALTNVRVVGNYTLSTGARPSNPDGGTALTDNVTATINSAVIDTAFGSTRGSILYRGAAGWTILSPGTSGYALSSNGAGADPSYQVIGGSGTVANPSALVGLTAINGSNTSAIRSDGAPALNQAIIPTWTGLHTFSLTDAATNTTSLPIVLQHLSSGTPAAGFGVLVDIKLHDASNSLVNAGYEKWIWSDAIGHVATRIISLNSGSSITDRLFIYGDGGMSLNANADPGAGIFNANTGFRIGNAATTAHYLRGNGTNYIDGAIQAGDVPDLSGTYVTAAGTYVFTNKTFDSNATGNVFKRNEYLQLGFPDNGDGTNAIRVTTEGPTFGHYTLKNAVAKASNFVLYRFRVPDDLDTSVDLAASFSFRLTGADTGKHSYYISMADVTASASADLPTFSNEIALSFGGDASGASGDMEQVAYTTLTTWKSSLTAGHIIVVKLARDGSDGTLDSSTVDSNDLNLTIRYGSSQ